MYKEYAQALNANDQVLSWIDSVLKNYLKNNKLDVAQDQVEHIIDYLVSPDAPQKNLTAMSYTDAFKNAEKWMKVQIKKGEHIKETAKDTKVVLDFKDGFKIVQLVGKNAYEREGYLMRHCVASYYGSSKEIYSLRDSDNMPHCTMEKDQQVKGKGNGNIHPKYVGYVVQFLEHVGMTVGDSEMAHLGYINVEKFKKDLSKDTKYFNKKYVPDDEKLLDKDGKEFASLDLFDVKPLIKVISDTELKINFNLDTFLPLAFNFLWRNKKTTDKNIAEGYSSTAASSGNSSKAASSGDCSTAASSGDSSTAASSGNSSKAASSGDYSKAASSGNSSKAASLGSKSQAEAEGEETIACALGAETKAKGKIGTWLVLSEYDKDWKKILAIKSVKIDGKKIKEGIWYELKNGKFSEVK